VPYPVAPAFTVSAVGYSWHRLISAPPVTMDHSSEPPLRPPMHRRGRLPTFEPTSRHDIGGASLGSSSLGSTNGKVTSKGLPLGYDPNLLGVYLQRSFSPVGKHTRSKSCGSPGSSPSVRLSESIGSESAGSQKRDQSTPSTPGPQTRTHTRSTSHGALRASSRLSDGLRWDLNNLPGVHDVALEPYSSCIGYTKGFLRCKNLSRCGQSASDAIQLAQGVPNIKELEKIAGNLLCNANHQSQKRDIAKRWLKQLTPSPKSPESTVSQDDYDFWGTPGPGSASTATTPGLSSPSPDIPKEDPASPTAARNARVVAKRSEQPATRRTYGAPASSGGRSGGSGADSASSSLDLGFDGSRDPRVLINFFGSNASSRGPTPDVPPPGRQDNDDVFTEGFQERLEQPILLLAGDTPGSKNETASIGQIGPTGGIIPPDLRKILGLADRTCVCRNRSKPGNCSRKIGEEKWKKSTEILESLAGRKLPGEAKTYFDGLEKFARLVLCRQHKKWAREEVDHWRSVIVASIGYPILSSRIDSSPAPKAPLITPTVPKVTAGPEVTTGPETSKTRSEKDTRRLSSRVNINFVLVDTRHPEIGQFEKCYSEKKAQKISVRAALTRSLTSRELKPGYIYIYWYPGNFGYLKIGVTTKTIAERLKTWETRCKRKPLCVYPKKEEEKEKWTSHIYRVEALVKAELKHHQRKGRCVNCGTEHQEWFEIPKESALSVVEKWRSWMVEKPRYVQTRQAWILNDISENELRLISHPSKVAIEKPPKQAPRSSLQIPATSRTRRTSLAQRVIRHSQCALPQEIRECECVAKSSDSRKRLRPKKCSGACQAKIPTNTITAESASTASERTPSTNREPSTTNENSSTKKEDPPITNENPSTVTNNSPPEVYEETPPSDPNPKEEVETPASPSNKTTTSNSSTETHAEASPTPSNQTTRPIRPIKRKRTWLMP
jgi:T5orf172 domain